MAKDVQVISRIARILGALSVRDSGSLVEISAACQLPVSTTSRLLDSLEREGLVERDYALPAEGIHAPKSSYTRALISAAPKALAQPLGLDPLTKQSGSREAFGWA